MLKKSFPSLSPGEAALFESGFWLYMWEVGISSSVSQESQGVLSTRTLTVNKAHQSHKYLPRAIEGCKSQTLKLHRGDSMKCGTDCIWRLSKELMNYGGKNGRFNLRTVFQLILVISKKRFIDTNLKFPWEVPKLKFWNLSLLLSGTVLAVDKIIEHTNLKNFLLPFRQCNHFLKINNGKVFGRIKYNFLHTYVVGPQKKKKEKICAKW